MGTIGAAFAPDGHAVVDVVDWDGIRRTAATAEHNHVWVRDFEPDHEYRYQVTVDDRPWAGERWDWRLGPHGDTFAPSGHGYDLPFRTQPDAHEVAPVPS